MSMVVFGDQPDFPADAEGRKRAAGAYLRWHLKLVLAHRVRNLLRTEGLPFVPEGVRVVAGLPPEDRERVVEWARGELESLVGNLLLLLGNAAGNPLAGIEGLGYTAGRYLLQVVIDGEPVTINDELPVLFGESESLREFENWASQY